MRMLCVVRYLVVPRWCSQEIWFCRKLKRWDAITRRALYLHDWLVFLLGIYIQIKHLPLYQQDPLPCVISLSKRNERKQQTGRIALSIVDNRTCSSEKNSGWKRPLSLLSVCHSCRRYYANQYIMNKYSGSAGTINPPIVFTSLSNVLWILLHLIYGICNWWAWPMQLSKSCWSSHVFTVHF